MPQLRWPGATWLAATCGAVVCALAAFASAGACTFIVGDSLPSYTCSPNANGVGLSDLCSADQVCAPVAGPAGQPSVFRCIARCSHVACGAGLRCDSTDWCVSVNDAGADATLDSDSTPADATVDAGGGDTVDAIGDAPFDTRIETVPDAASEATDMGRGDAAACSVGGIGCPCSTPGTTTGCELLAFCVDKQTVALAPPSDSGTDAGADLEGGAGVCTKACCTSSDCDKGSVCFATGGGGNYCVPAATLGDRATTGPLNAPAGQACDAGSSCRSGLCSSIPSFCADTCCAGPARSMANSAGQCLQGMACRIGTFQGAGNDMNYVPRCAVPMGASGNNGSPCTSNSDCRSNLCLNDTAQDLTCRDPCRKPEDCSGMGMFQAAQTCEYLQLSGTGAAINPLVAACVPLTPSGPNLPDAAADWGPCKTSSDCARGYCGQSTAGMVCVSVCFGDGDCVSSGMCRPQTLLVNGAVYSVLACK